MIIHVILHIKELLLLVDLVLDEVGSVPPSVLKSVGL